MDKSIDLVDQAVQKIANAAGIKGARLLVRRSSSPDGYPFVEIKSGSYYLVSEERGREISRSRFDELDDVVYVIIRDALKEECVAFELVNRVPGKDTRRIYFRRFIERMSAIDESYGSRARSEVDDILARSPFRDGSYEEALLMNNGGS